MPRKPKARTDGEGSVYEEGSGWRAQIILPDGRKIRRSAPTKKAAYALLRELKHQMAAHVKIGAAAKLTMNDLFDRWLAQRATWLKPRTLAGYTEIVNRYLRPELGSRSLAKLTPATVTTWLGNMRKRPHKRRTDGTLISETTVQNALQVLHTALNFAVQERLIVTNSATMKHEPHPSSEILALDEQQIVTLLAALSTHRLYALFALAALTGMRQAEIVGLRWRFVDLNSDAPSVTVAEQLHRLKGPDGKLMMVKQAPKTAAGKRAIPLAANLVAALRAHKLAQAKERLTLGERWRADDLVFTSEAGTPINVNNVRRLLRATQKRAKLPYRSFHSLRHSAGSLMLARGIPLIDVSKILGHSSPAITAKTYSHSFADGKRRAIAALDGLISPQKVG